MNILKLIFEIVVLVMSAYSMDVDTARMAVDYFSYKNINQICSIVCTGNKWLRDLAVVSSAAGIRMSSVAAAAVAGAGSRHRLEGCLRQQHAPVGVLLDVRCRAAADILNRNSEDRNFDAMHNWLIIEFPSYERTSLVAMGNSSDSTEASIVTKEDIPSAKINLISGTLLEHLNISIDAEITVAVYSDQNEFYLFDVFNFGKIQGGTLNITSMGKWDKNHGLEIWLSQFKYQRRWDFHNLKLRAISVMLVHPKVFAPELLTSLEYTPGVTALTKISAMILHLFSEKHNFRFKYTIADRWVGSTGRNSVLAVTNSMLWREQDVSATGARIFPTWLDWMDPFFPPTTYVETKFYYRIPSDGVGKLENEFLRPFSKGVWMCTICAAALCGAAIAAAARMDARPKSIQFAFFSVIAAFCQQMFEEGSRSEPSSRMAIPGQSQKLALLVTGFSSLLLYNYYTSSVVSWLLSAPPPSIDSLDELIASSLEVVFEDIGYTRSWLEVPGYYYGRNRSPKEDELREKKAKSNTRTTAVLQPVDRGIELVKKGGYAYHTEPYNANFRIGRTFSQKELCDLGSLQMMERVPVYIVGQRRSPYREFFVWSMMRAQERGHVSCLRQRVRVAEPECAGSTPRALALGGAAPAFLLLAACGWGASLLLLLLEIIIDSISRKRSEI